MSRRATRTESPRKRATSFAPQPTRALADRLLLTVEEAAATIGVGRSLMYELIAAGQIATVRVGRLRRVSPEALRNYVASLTIDGSR